MRTRLPCSFSERLTTCDPRPTSSLLSAPAVLNRTHTPMATRLLRSNLLQPTRVKSTLEARLDAVDGTSSEPTPLR
jgi:DNA mismatch repair ATPase MutS